MAQKKMLSTPVEMCKPFPVLEKFYWEVLGMEYDQEPDYNHLVQM
jgi:hypothetical protein